MHHRLAAAAVVAVLGLAPTPALAAGTTVPCQPRAMTQPFRAWGDQGWYFGLPNSGFESGTTDWWLAAGGAVLAGNEPWHVRAAADGHLLRLPAGASATSRTICVRRGEDILRLFVRSPGVVGASLRVEERVWNRANGAQAVNTYAIDGSVAGWRPSPQIRVSDLGGDVDLEVYLRSTGSAATWDVDDVYLDPYRGT